MDMDINVTRTHNGISYKREASGAGDSASKRDADADAQGYYKRDAEA
jgi:hypothetical protein